MSAHRKDSLANERLAVLENGVINLENSINDIKVMFSEIKIDMAGIRTDIREINNRIWKLYLWSLGAFIGVLDLIAKGFHWIT